MLNNLTFKIATPVDASVIYELAEKIWYNHYVPIIGKKQVEYMLKKIYSETAQQEQMINGQEFTIAYNNEIPVGYFSVSKKEHEYFLHKLYVLTDKHNIGLGSQMLHEILRKATDGKKIRLTVNRQNFKAINFYFKHGFVIESVEDFDIGDGYFMNDFVMVKKLP